MGSATFDPRRHGPLFTALGRSRFLPLVGSDHQNLNGSRGLTTPLSEIVCHPWASTCYDQPVYQIWSLYLYPLRSYERRYKISKIWWFGVVRGHLRQIAPFYRAHTIFYLVFHSITMSLLHRFWDTTKFCSKIANLNLPHFYLVPPWGWPLWNFAEILAWEN